MDDVLCDDEQLMMKKRAATQTSKLRGCFMFLISKLLFEVNDIPSYLFQFSRGIAKVQRNRDVQRG
jgi:hypothetical protein